MKKLATLIIMAALAAIALPASATSLWTQGARNLYTDSKAAYVGDIITITVSDTTTATQKSNTALSQSDKTAVSSTSGVIGQFIEPFGAQSSDAYSGTGTTTSSGTLTTTISAEVVEVLPNGNLVIEAKKTQVVNEETQYVILTGTVRPADISRDNIVASTKIANLNITYKGKGASASRQKQGIINKLFDILF